MLQQLIKEAKDLLKEKENEITWMNFNDLFINLTKTLTTEESIFNTSKI